MDKEFEEEEEDGACLLSCPGCGHSMDLKDGDEGNLTCPNGHRFTLETLIFGQSLRVETLLHAAIQFLLQQKGLVRGLAQQLWESQTVGASKLDVRADRIEETISKLRELLKDREKSSDLKNAGDRFSLN